MKETLKICYLISSLANEGPVNVLYNIIYYLDPKQFDVSIITLVPEKDSSRIDDFKKLPVRIIQLKGDGVLKPVDLYRKLKQAITIEAPTILHSHCPRSYFLMALLPKIGAKKTYTFHLYPGIQQKVLYGNLMGTVVIRLSKYFIKKIDQPFACAENVSESFLKNDKLLVLAVPNGGSFFPTTISSDEKAVLRKNLGLDANITYLIFIGRLSKEKNPEFLVAALKKMNRENIGLIMLGEGPLKKSLQAINYTQLIMPGFVSNVNEYILASDYYVSPSLTEGLANTLLETMAMGLPFILSDIPPHLEVYNKTEDFMGVIFKNNNQEDFGGQLKTLLVYPRQQAADAVRKCFTAHYTADKMSRAYQDSYFNLVKL